MKKIVWLVIIIVVVFGVWALMNKPAEAPSDSMEQEIAEHAPEGTTGADDGAPTVY